MDVIRLTLNALKFPGVPLKVAGLTACYFPTINDHSGLEEAAAKKVSHGLYKAIFLDFKF